MYATKSDSLDAEQKKRIEENRRKAIALRNASIARLETEGSRTEYSSRSTNDSHVKFAERNPQISKNLTAASQPKSLAKVVGSCSVTSRCRFTVTVNYHQKLVDIFKTLPSNVYDSKTRLWSIDIKDHDYFINRVKVLQPEIFIEPLPKFVVKAFLQRQLKEMPSVNLGLLDSALVEALFPFQKEAVSCGILREGRVLLADDMGLGKTIQAIAIAAYFRKEWPLLIVCPSSMRYSWKQALENWLTSLKKDLIVVLDGPKPVDRFSILIITYDLIVRMTDFVRSKNFRVVIVDESHLLKNFKSQRAKAVLPIVKNARRAILLSGTPALSRPVELFTQISALNGELFPSFQHFGLRYCNGKMLPWGWDYSGASNLNELQAILEERVMIRRLKADVVSQLPDKCRELVFLDAEKIKFQTAALKSAATSFSKATHNGIERRGTLLKYFSETAHSKLDAVCDYVIGMLDAGKKFICFAHHQIVLSRVCEAIESQKCNYIKIDGSTSSVDRKVLCDQFQNSDTCRVAVLSITAANMGITLTSSHLVIFAELFWNPGVLLQAEDRAHRIGQRDSVLIQYLVAKGTADDYMWGLIQEKVDVLNKAGLVKGSFEHKSVHLLQNGCQQHRLDSYFTKEYSDVLDGIDWDDTFIDINSQPQTHLQDYEQQRLDALKDYSSILEGIDWDDPFMDTDDHPTKKTKIS